MLCALFLNSLSYLTIVLYYLPILLLIGSVVCGGTLYIVYLFRLVVYRLLLAWCCVCLVYWCLLLLQSVLYIGYLCTWCWFVCVGYSLNLCYILAICVRGVGIVLLFSICCLFRLYWLVPLLPYNFTTLPLLPLYIASIRVYSFPWCIAGIIYDKAPLKGAYLLVLVLLGWCLYIIFPLLG